MNMKKYVNVTLLFLVYGAFAYIFWPFKQACIFALLFAFALNPLLVKLRSLKKIKLSEFKAITILIGGLFGVLFLPLIVILIKLASLISKINSDQISDSPILQKTQHFFVTIFDLINNYALKYGFDLATQIDIKAYAAAIGKSALAVATDALSNVPSAILQFVVFIALLYYFLLNQSRLKQSLIKMDFLSDAQVSRLAQLFEKVCNLVLVSSVVIALLQATIVSLACLVVGFDGVLIIFMIAFFMAFIPVVGSGPLTISLIIYSLINASYGSAIVLIIAAIVAGVLDNVIKSIIFSSSEDSVSPLIALLVKIGRAHV